MPDFIIRDAASGRAAEVNAINHLETVAVTVAASTYSTERGDSYNINTTIGNGGSKLSLTNASESGLLYIKNTESGQQSGVDKDLVIDTLFINLGTSTNGSGEAIVRIVRNPTAGTLISGGTSMSAVNRNFSNSKTPNATILYGGQGSTVTDGSDILYSTITSAPARAVIPVDFILKFGDSMAVLVTPPASNTSMGAEVAAKVYIKTFQF